MATRQQRQGLSPAAQRAKENAKKREQEKQGSAYVNIPKKMKFEFFKPEEGLNIIDIIPYEVKTEENMDQIPVGDIWYKRLFKRHGGIGAENKPVVCPTNIGKKCPICESVQKLYKNYEENKDLINEIKAKDRTLMFVIDRQNKKRGIQLFDISAWAFSDRIPNFIDASGDDSLWSFFELNGKKLRVNFEKKQFGKKGTSFEASAIFFQTREAYDKSILKKTFDLDADSVLEILSYDDLKKLYHEDDDFDKDDNVGDIDQEEDSDIDKEEDEEEDIDEEDEEENEDETEEEDEEDTDETEEEDEEDTDETEEEDEEEDIDEEDEDKEPEPPKNTTKKKTTGKKTTSKKASSSKSSKNKCPAGGKFGKDNDELDECDTCDIWEECNAEFGKTKK